MHHISFKRKNRERSIGPVGRPFKLDVKNRFLMILVYYRLYITYTLSEFLFHINQSNICRDIQNIEYGILNMVRDCLSIPQKLYNKTKRLRTPDEVEKYFPGFLAFIDSTEQQQLPRPVYKRRCIMLYSLGNKKRHTTVKNQIMVNNRGHIIHKVIHKKRKRHIIYSIYKEDHPAITKEVVIVADLGYHDIEKDFPEQVSSAALPSKKKRNQDELSKEEEIEYNKFHFKKRIVIESIPSSFVD